MHRKDILAGNEITFDQWKTLENALRVTNITSQIVTGDRGECPFTTTQLRKMGWDIHRNTPRIYRGRPLIAFTMHLTPDTQTP